MVLYGNRLQISDCLRHCGLLYVCVCVWAWVCVCVCTCMPACMSACVTDANIATIDPSLSLAMSLSSTQ